MRDGDNTYRPRNYIAESNMNGIGDGSSSALGLARDDVPTVKQREGDDTYRPRDAVTAQPLHESDNSTGTDTAAERQADHAAMDEDDAPSWVVPLSFVVSAFALSVLLVKFAFLLRDAWGLPIVARELALVGIFICFAAIFYAVVSLARVFRKLPQIEQASKLDFASNPIPIKRQAKQLHKYLQTAFPKDKKSLLDYVKLIGQHEWCYSKFQWLSNEIDDYEDWMSEFCIFEKMQDDAAQRCIIKRAGLVFVKTGVSPWKVIDAVAVLYHSVMMTTELAKIYRRRISRFQAFRLALDGLMAIGVASVAQDALDKVAETLTSKVFEAGSKLISGIISKAAAKTAEGTLNAALVYRLGCRMQLRFKPLVKKAERPSPKAVRGARVSMVFSIIAIVVAAVSLMCRFQKSQDMITASTIQNATSAAEVDNRSSERGADEKTVRHDETYAEKNDDLRCSEADSHCTGEKEDEVKCD